MKEVNIIIRFDDGKFGFAIDREKGDANSQSEVLKFIAALEVLKLKEISRLERIGGFKKEYNN